MVTHACEYSFRRLSRAGQSYPTLQDRPYPPPGTESSHRGFSVSSHGSRGSEHDIIPEPNEPRRRIPVACGRCRKRKIRCSGEPKGGGPCTNCKNAGSDVCQFLRVSSTETPMKVELADVSFDNASARVQLPVRSMPYGTYGNPTYPQPEPILGSDGSWSTYRAHSVSGYPYSVKQHHGLPSYHAEFSEADGSAVDYNVQHPALPVMSPEYLTVQSYAGRGWIHPNKNGLMYQDASPPNYTHDQSTYHHGYGLRPTTSPEGKSYSMASMQASLPVPSQITGNDRVLPYPAINRPVQPTETYLRSSDVLPSSQVGVQSYNGLGVLTANTLKPAHSSNSSESNYIPMSTSPDSSSSQLRYGGANISVNQQHGDIYNSTNESGLFQNQGMRSSSGVDVDYNYSPDVSLSSKRGSQSHSGGELVNGHPYIPHNHGQQSAFPTPSPPLAQPLPHRTSSSSLHAVDCQH